MSIRGCSHVGRGWGEDAGSGPDRLRSNPSSATDLPCASASPSITPGDTHTGLPAECEVRLMKGWLGQW